MRRNIAKGVEAALKDTRVVLVAGARQVGKSTLLSQILTLNDRRGDKARILTLDNATVLAAAKEDPISFVKQHPSGTLAIDEVQRCPELFLAIKEVVDSVGRPGQFLLTGSANVFALPLVADSLAGRIEVIDLYPLSQGERRGFVDNLVDALFEGQPPIVSSSIQKDDYMEMAVIGGYPEVQFRSRPERRRAWFTNYLRTLVQRDLRELADLQRLDDIEKILRALAAYTSNLINEMAMSREIGIPNTTLQRYLAHIENIFLFKRLPAWSSNRLTRVVSAPKVHIVDSGIGGHLIGQSTRALVASTGYGGHILESFVVMEIIKQVTWSARKPTPYHFRTHDNVEVDLVLETADGDIVGIEIKSSGTVGGGDFKGLRTLASKAGERFRAGVVLYTGGVTVPFGVRMWAAPISALWSVT